MRPDSVPRSEVVADVIERARASAVRPIVLIDGGSGAGKTELARAVVRGWGAPITLVRLEDIYPGWDGLEAASAQLHDEVLAPLLAGTGVPRWRRWDWTRDAPAEWHQIDPELPLVVEGSGSLSRANRGLATLGVWIELDAVTRKRRALDRDGDAYRPFWDRWAAQEAAFAHRERPAELAELVIRG